jgi:hypothetical protein
MANATCHQILVVQAAPAVKADALKAQQDLVTAEAETKEAANVVASAEVMTVNQAVVALTVVAVAIVRVAKVARVGKIVQVVEIAPVVQEEDNN